MPYPCFFIEPTKQVERYLRRYTHAEKRCPRFKYSGHDAKTRIEDGAASFDAEGYSVEQSADNYKHSDARWPAHCECGYAFVGDDEWQLFTDLIYERNDDTHERMTLRSAPAGAMWHAWWMSIFWQGPDGLCLTVKTPGGEWAVDGRASNCGLPDDRWDTPGHHYCWIRHGDPREVPCRLTVDKNGKTCNAGAGSIQSGSYHGFLHNGNLT